MHKNYVPNCKVLRGGCTHTLNLPQNCVVLALSMPGTTCLALILLSSTRAGNASAGFSNEFYPVFPEELIRKWVWWSFGPCRDALICQCQTRVNESRSLRSLTKLSSRVQVVQHIEHRCTRYCFVLAEVTAAAIRSEMRRGS